MTEKRDDGGQAFPRAGALGDGWEGMTLLDYFAIHAPEPSDVDINLQHGIDKSRNPHNDTYKPPLRSRLAIIAELKYRYADAMLAERSK